MGILLTILLVALLIYVFKGIIIVQQQQEVIIERMGRYEKTLRAGPNFIFPVLEAPRGILKKVSQKGIDGRSYYYLKAVDRIDLREQMYDFPRQNVITKDNVSITINALIYFQIVDAKSAVYEIENLPDAIEKLTQTTLRNLVGQMDLQETLTSRGKINDELRTTLDEATNKWGVKVNRVEIQDIFPPADIQASMDKLMKADREKKATITEAEGLKDKTVKEENLQPGDLIFYSYTINGRYKNISHVGIYVGNGKMVEAVDEAHGVCLGNYHNGGLVMICRPGK